MPPLEKRPLATLTNRFWYRAIWRLSPSRLLHRIRTAVWLGAEDADRCFDRVDEALDIVQRYDPSTSESIRKNFAGILVFGDEKFRVAYWSNASGLCIITSRYLEAPSVAPEDVALTLVHENMHAKLHNRGAGYPEGRRAAIEVLCAMAELAFARRVGYSPGLVEKCESRIQAWATGGEAPWSDESHRTKRLQQLRDMGTPVWLVSAIERLGRVFRGRAA